MTDLRRPDGSRQTGSTRADRGGWGGWSGWAGWVALVLAGLLAARTLISDWRLAAPRRLGETGDLSVYLGALEHLADGGRLYDWTDGQGYGFTYPPFAAVLLRPLIAAEPTDVGRVWLAVSLALVVLVAGVVVVRGGYAAQPWTPQPWPLAWLLLGIALFAASVQVQSDLITGQINLLLALLLVLDLGAVVPERWRGLLTGLAAAVKLTPLLAVVWLVVTRQWRPALRAVGVFLAAGLVGFLALPGDSLDYWGGAVADVSRVGDLAAPGNVSVSGALARAGVHGVPHTVSWLLVAGVVVLAAFARASRAQAQQDRVAAVVLLGCAAVVASPVSWPHHQIWLPLAGLVLLSRGRPVATAAGLIVVSVCVFHVPWSRWVERTGSGWLAEYDLALFAAICLLGLGARARPEAARRPLVQAEP